MSFGLKNVGSTYQRMMTRMFGSLLGKNIEIYIDDMVVKSKVVSEHLEDLRIIFEILRNYKLHSKCFQVFIRRRVRQILRLHGHSQGN